VKHKLETSKPFDDIKTQDREWQFLNIYIPKDGDTSKFVSASDPEHDAENGNAYFEIASANKVDGSAQRAYMLFENSISGKFGGHKTSELAGIKRDNPSFVYLYRNSDGSVGRQITGSKDAFHFTPTSGDASDGGLVDLSNPARAKGTVAGAAAGGALGGFAGYQGAQDEITERWLASTREYEDSLSNFVCMTGTRFLSKYNDYVEIPEMNKSE